MIQMRNKWSKYLKDHLKWHISKVTFINNTKLILITCKCYIRYKIKRWLYDNNTRINSCINNQKKTYKNNLKTTNIKKKSREKT